MEKSISRYGVVKQNAPNNEVEYHLESLKLNGLAIIKNVLAGEEVNEARARLGEVYKKQVAEVGQDIMQKINDINIVRAVLAYDSFFMHKVALNPRIIDILNVIFSKNFILREQNGIINDPAHDNFQLHWHRDILFQDFTSSKPIGISCLFCLDDFNLETGGTHFLKSSHKAEFFPSDKFILENEFCPTASSGDAILFDSMIYHRAGLNRSKNLRRAINNVYVLPIMKQSVDLTKMMTQEKDLSLDERKILGFGFESDESVIHWRRKRASKS